jgi:hypothetical protein
MRKPTPATMMSMKPERLSRRRLKGMPGSHSAWKRAPPPRRRPTPRRKERRTSPEAKTPGQGSRILLPKRPRRANPRRGRRITNRSVILPPKLGKVVKSRALPVAEDGHDEAQAHGHLGGGDGDHHEGGYLALEAIGPGEAHQGEVGGVQHELNGEKDQMAVLRVRTP